MGSLLELPLHERCMRKKNKITLRKQAKRIQSNKMGFGTEFLYSYEKGMARPFLFEFLKKIKKFLKNASDFKKLCVYIM